MKTLAHHILDITENSINARAQAIDLRFEESHKAGTYRVIIRDNGAGMDQESLRQVTDPYYTTRTTRKVGLGLALIRQNAEQTGGKIDLQSVKGKGTEVTADFGYHHIDLPPTGDLAGVLTAFFCNHPGVEFRYAHTTDDGEFSLSTSELKENLEGMPLNAVPVQKLIKELIANNQEEIKIKR